MKTENKFATAATLLVAPIAAFAATDGAPHIELYALAGGAAGGFMGALLACWLCKRRSSCKDGTGTDRQK